MNCRKAEHLIFAERDGALDELQRAALVSHLGTCAICRRVQAGLTATVATWRSAHERVRIPDAELEWHKVRREIRGGAGSVSASRRKTITWYAVPLAAAAAIAVGLFVNQESQSSPAGTQPKPTVARATPANESASTVVFVDEKSGWTFVVADDPHRG